VSENKVMNDKTLHSGDLHYDVVVIGGGPAGLAAATYATKAHLTVALVAPDLGGKVGYSFALRGQAPVDTVWGSELVHQFETYVKMHLDDYYQGAVNRVDKLDTEEFRVGLELSTEPPQPVTLDAKTVIVCTGAGPQRLFIPGEQEFWGSGVSFSAISHASLFRGRKVLVVGHGDRALLAAIQLAALAEHTYFMPTAALDDANPQVQQIREHPRISVLDGWELLRIEGTDYVKQVAIAKGYDTQMLDVEGVFVEMGLLPNKEFLRNLIEFDPETGRIPINQRCETRVTGLFAAGDVTDAFAEQAPVAMGEGVKAALSVWEYLARQAQLHPAPAPASG